MHIPNFGRNARHTDSGVQRSLPLTDSSAGDEGIDDPPEDAIAGDAAGTAAETSAPSDDER
jgi:hypothetical protein